MCFACGVENPVGLRLHFYDDGVDEVTSDFAIADHHQGYPGIAQGGIVAAILDEVGGRTVMIGDPRRFFMTGRLDVKYRQPVPTSVPLRAVGKLLKLKAKLATAHAEIRSPAGEVLAEAELILANVPMEVINPSEADRLGWRVYDPQ
jgi:acyl-coenzyme A thioesterase PaaI-like protein